MIQPKISLKEPRQLSPEKAEAILAGGMQEFLAHGYAGTSMDRIAAASDVVSNRASRSLAHPAVAVSVTTADALRFNAVPALDSSSDPRVSVLVLCV